MFQFPIGVMLESFRLPRAEAIKKAAEIGAVGIQMFATRGENTPDKLTPAMRRELRDEVESAGLCFSAICGDMGGGFGFPDRNPEIIEKSKEIIDMALELGTNVVTTHIGVVPQDKNHDRYKIMQEACFELSRYADSADAHFAIETGPETSLELKGFLDEIGSKGLGVNLDPANLVMVTGDDPVQAVYNLRDYIVHTHAKDGVMLQKCNPEYIYKVVHPVPEEVGGIRYFQEVPLGTGNVDFPAYLAALEDIGYRGFLTIEREVGDSPEKDIKTAFGFLKETIEKN
ncbi:MAG: sugar phosphate isomerase/epimerase [Clostridia bacterium]|nr:sugar phosphate isomerase/epimerase [Clostridia bacterium]